MTTSSRSLALEVSGLTKIYGGEIALADADLRVGRGEIHGLLGANGAGKSTLVKIVSGAETADAGTVTIQGHELPPRHRPADAQDQGLAIIHQDRALMPALSIADNIGIVVGFPRRRGGTIDAATMRATARAALDRVGMTTDVDTLVADLPIAEQTLVAIARALALQAQVLILDEPTANLGAVDARNLYDRIRRLAADGVACVLISHALDECLDVCDRVTVLRDGRVVGSHDATDLDAHRLASLVVGHEVTTTREAHRVVDRTTTPRLRVVELSDERIVPLSFDVAPGEVVGITGLPDSGHLHVGELVAGLAPAEGRLELDGTGFTPDPRINHRVHRVAYLPPDRLRDGLAVDLTARENLFMDGRHPTSGARMGRAAETSLARTLMQAIKVKPPVPGATLSTLSGGNAQKVLLAKWLATEPRLLVLAEPTVGVDIGAREDLYARVREARDAGLAVLLTSSDLEETIALSDRVLVLRYGELVAERSTEGLTLDHLTALTNGAREGEPA